MNVGNELSRAEVRAGIESSRKSRENPVVAELGRGPRQVEQG